MNDRFSDINISFMKSIDCLNPMSKNFQTFLVRNPIPEDKKDACYLLEHIDPVKEAFSVLRGCLMVAMTFVTSTATVNAVFNLFVNLFVGLRHTCAPLCLKKGLIV